MAVSLRNPVRAFGWMSCAALCFSTMNVFAKVASAHTHFALVSALRAAIGALLAFATARASHSSLRVHNQRAMWLRSAFGTLAMLCTFAALSAPALPISDTATLLNLSPVGIALLSPLVLGERSGRRVFVSVGICLVGALCILRPSFLTAHGHSYPRGPAVIAITGAACTACAMMMLRRVRGESSAGVAFHFSLVACAVSAAIGLPQLLRLGAPPPAAWAPMLITGVAAGIGQLCMTRAYALDHAARVAAYGYLTVAGSALLAFVVRGERLDGLSLLGMLTITAGGLLVSLTAKRPEAD